VSSVFPLFPFSSYLFSSPLSLAVWATIVPLGWRWNGWRRLRLRLGVLIAEHGHGWVVNGGEAWRSTWRAVMCPALGLGHSGAASDRIGEGNFEFHAVGEGTVVAGGGYGCGQGDGVTVRAGLQLGDGERRKMTWRARGARRSGLERKVGVQGQGESLPRRFRDPVSPLLTTAGTEDWGSGRKAMTGGVHRPAKQGRGAATA
jgi:hypothetical protein